MKWHAPVRLIALLALISSLFSTGQASALSGYCGANTLIYLSVICGGNEYAEGIYAEWPSVNMNIAQASAQNGEYIMQGAWVYNDWPVGSDGSNAKGLWIADRAGGSITAGHENEWARMWTFGSDTAFGPEEFFIEYAPSDGVTRAWGIQWNPDQEVTIFCCPPIVTRGAWGVYIAGTKYADIVHFGAPQYLQNIRTTQGMLLFNGSTGGQPRPLDANMSSGLFTVQNVLRRSDATNWIPLGSPPNGPFVQIDRQCGTPPSCMWGYWVNPPTAYSNQKP